MAKESEDLALDAATVEKSVRYLCQHPEFGQYYVLKQSDKPIGCLLVTYEFSDWTNQFYAWLQSVYILPAERGQGLFSEMLQHLQRALNAHSLEIKEIRLYVEKNNTRAHKAYVNSGFEASHYDIYTKPLSCVS